MRRHGTGKEDASETRGRIVDIARDLFMKHGYRAVSTRKIAQACAITQPALYHHFADKEAIYVEVMRREIEKTKTAFTSILANTAELEERLVRIVYYLTLAVPDDINQMFRDIQNELQPDARFAVQQLWHDGYLQPIVSVFTDGIARGLLKQGGGDVPDARQSAFLLLRLVARTGPADRDEQAAMREARMAVSLLLHGLAARPSDG